MRNVLLAATLLFTSAASIAQTNRQVTADPSTSEYVRNTLYPATVLLFSQNDDGGMRMRCTATSFEKTADGYRFATAAHCATKEGKEENDNKKPTAENAAFYVSSDVVGAKDYVPVKIDGCGSREHGDDFCVFRAKTTRTFPVAALGVDPTDVAGEDVINIAAPLGLGKQAFYGRITKPYLDRKLVQDDINWSGVILLQMPGTNGGSSGSAVVCAQQRAICGFLVGVVGGTEVVAIPVSRFKKFLELSDTGKYKWFDKSGDE